ncbi:MAG: ROK family transcriptional regulator [Pseudomonadota bacterium]
MKYDAQRTETQHNVSRSDDVRRRNRHRIISCIRRAGPISRKAIGSRLGLSPATVTAITTNLLARKILVEASARAASGSGRGRPNSVLSLNPDVGLVALVDLRLNSISAITFDYAGSQQGFVQADIETLAASRQRIRATLIGCLHEVLATSGRKSADIRQIVVSVQGVTDAQNTRLLWSPITKHTNLSIRAWLEREFAKPAWVCNDCNMAARGLNWRDPKRYSESFAAILLAHGVGMGLFLRGEPISGTRSSGTEFGHMTYIPNGALCRCGSRGCIEAYAGDYAVLRRASGRPETERPASTVHPDQLAEIVQAAQDGHADSIAALETAGRALGTGLATMFALVDPFPFALIGSGTLAQDPIERALRETLAKVLGPRNFSEASDASIGSLPIDFIREDDALVRMGGAIYALSAVDREIAETAY